jgi:hypothetical protein
MSDFSRALLNRLNYHKTLHSSENAINNLKKMNGNLNESNIFTLAYLANNPALSEEERNIFMECVKAKASEEYETYSREIQRVLANRKEDIQNNSGLEDGETDTEEENN